MATTKKAATKPPAKKPAQPSAGAAGAKSEQAILNAVNALRADPKKYAKLQRALRGAKTDEARVKQLLKYATSERELASLLPADKAGRAQAAAWTTVTITTVFIPTDAN